MNKPAKIIFVILGILLLTYLWLPEPPFPTGLWDFKQSAQPADQETDLRRGYYTNLTREQLMSHYSKEFDWGVRLNYPPEESQTLIRDQTKSSFLEEVAHPMRESLFISGYMPKSDQEILAVDGVHYDAKVIVKYVGSNLFLRLLVGILAIVGAWFLINEWIGALKSHKWISQ